MTKSPHAPALLAILADERAALLHGALAELPQIAERKQAAIERLGRDPRPMADSIRRDIANLAQRNQELLDASAKGLRNVIQRIGELQALQQGRSTYSADGSRNPIRTGPPKHERRA